MRAQNPPTSRQDVPVAVCAAAQWSEVKALWTALEQASPHASFFLTTEWTECWLEHCAAGLQVEFVVFRAGDRPVGICLLTYKTAHRGPIPVRRVYVNAAGEDERDSTCIEFNNLLCLEGWEEAVARALAGYVGGRNWDEIALYGFCAGPALEAFLGMFPDCRASHNLRPSHYVDLDAIRGAGKTYEDVLGQTTRKHLRQNYRNYGKAGELTVHAAGSVEEALGMLADLAVVHQESWVQRGKPGAFASESFMAFHRALIRRTFGSGGVQIWRVGAGDLIGFIYGLIYRGKVNFYQSGLRYTGDKRLSPGLVANACVINACLEAGFKEYDFLAGEVMYKKSLATANRELDWVVLQRPGWKLKGIELLRKVKAAARRPASS